LKEYINNKITNDYKNMIKKLEDIGIKEINKESYKLSED